jgi:hypothetical protein
MSLTIHCIRHPISRTSVLYSTFLCISCIHPQPNPLHFRHLILPTSATLSPPLPAPNPAYFRGLILPSVRSYRRFTHILCPRSPLLYIIIPLLLLYIPDVREIYSYSVSLTIHHTIMHLSSSNLSNIPSTYRIYPAPYPLRIVHVQHPIPPTSVHIRHPILRTSAVYFYLRYDLTRIHAHPVPAISTLYSIFIPLLS